MKRMVEISDDAFMEAFVNELKEQYEMCLDEMDRLSEIKDLKPHQKQDLKDNNEVADAILTVLRYNMTHREYHDYILSVVSDSLPYDPYSYDINMFSSGIV